jgi:hypothetical protein
MLSAQMDLDSVPEDGFFLVPPQQAFSHTTVSPLVIRPRALRVGDIVVEEEESMVAMPATVFRSIGESNDADTMYQEQSQNALTQVLKPRPTSFKEGQGVWDQMPKPTAMYGELKSELLEL